MTTLITIIVWGLVVAVLIYNCVMASRKWPASKGGERKEKLKPQKSEKPDPENLK